MPEKVYSIDLSKPDLAAVTEIAERLLKGELSILPTDTIYGFSSSPFFSDTLKRIVEIKKWDKPHPVILLIESLLVAKWMGLEVNEMIEKFHNDLQNIPVTMILPTTCGYRMPVKYEKGVAVRIEMNKFMKHLFSIMNSSLSSTSVNTKDENFINKPDIIREKFLDDVDFIVDGGEAKLTSPSTIVDFTGETPVIFRRGYKYLEIESTIKEIFL